MLKVNRTYRTLDGRQRFFIHTRKNIPSSNGCNFIGENVKTGLVCCFNHHGEHAWEKELNLECDPFTWIGFDGRTLGNTKFVKKEEVGTFPFYLKMEFNDPQTILCVDLATFRMTYL